MGACWVSKRLNLFLIVTRWRENLSSGEKRAASMAGGEFKSTRENSNAFGSTTPQWLSNRPAATNSTPSAPCLCPAVCPAVPCSAVRGKLTRVCALGGASVGGGLLQGVHALPVRALVVHQMHFGRAVGGDFIPSKALPLRWREGQSGSSSTFSFE